MAHLERSAMKTFVPFLLAVGASSAHAASIEATSFEVEHPKLVLSKTSVIGASSVGEPGRAFAPQAIYYHCGLGDVAVQLSEGAIALPAWGDEQEQIPWSHRRTDAKFSAHTFVFRSATSWSVSFLIGSPVRDDLNITRGICLSVRTASAHSAAAALRQVASALILYVGAPVAPKKLSDMDQFPMIAEVCAFLESQEPNKRPEPMAHH